MNDIPPGSYLYTIQENDKTVKGIIAGDKLLINPNEGCSDGFVLALVDDTPTIIQGQINGIIIGSVIKWIKSY